MAADIVIDGQTSRALDCYGLSGPAGAFFGGSVLKPLAFQSLSGQNVEAV